jgi:hypothetical protein
MRPPEAGEGVGPATPTVAPRTDGASASIDSAKSRAAQQHADDVAAGKETSEPAVPDEGVFASVEAPFATVVFRATSHWGGKVEGQGYVVYAGEDGQHASVGEVIVDPYDPGSGRRSRPRIHRLGGVGALRIVAANKEVLVLKDVRGVEHLFNVASGSFQQRCRAEHLRLGVEFSDALMSQPFADISITNIGAQACLLIGYPRIAVAGHHGFPDQPAAAAPVAITVHHRIYERVDPGPHMLTVLPQHRVFFSIGTADAYDGPLFTLTRLTVILPGTRSPKLVPISLLANGPPGRKIPIGVTAMNGSPHG